MRVSYFYKLLQKRGLDKHDGRPLWKYNLTSEEFDNLKSNLKYGEIENIDPRDVALYFSEWWKKHYIGGFPSKDGIYSSIGGNSKYNYSSKDLYKLAKQGGRMLKFKWITKQNTLFFKTLLLQGGLPLSHISENKSNYLNFLLAVLEVQPETIESFAFNPNITKFLPASSQNDIIYENSLVLVQSIMNGEKEFDQLLESNREIEEISKTLKDKFTVLKKVRRETKPKNYWLLHIDNGIAKIKLRLGLSNSYTRNGLSEILGFHLLATECQLYQNDRLVCVFRKRIDGNYKTDWYAHKDFIWDGDDSMPISTVW